MQQQIQLLRKATPKRPDAHRPPPGSDNERGFQIINDEQEIIQEDITENYEQDFDSLSNHSRKAAEIDNEIKEDFDEIESDFGQPAKKDNVKTSSNGKEEQHSDKDEQLQRERLVAQCENMRIQINLLKEGVLKGEQPIQADNTLQELQRAVEANTQTLRSQQAEQIDFFQTKVGKDSFCLQLLPTSQEFQQKLFEEIQKIKQIINMSNIEVCRIKRETKKNEEILPIQEESKEQFYQKYKKLKRQLDDKKEKYESQEQRERELQVKLQKLKEKYEEVESAASRLPDYDKKMEEQHRLSSIQQDLMKRREVEMKRNTLAMHQIQNNCQIIARNVLDLRKQNNEIQDKIYALQAKNTLVEEDSSKLMAKFESQREKNKLKSKEKDIQRNDSFHVSPTELKPIAPLSSNRRKYYSQTKNSFITNIFDNTAPIDTENGSISNDRYVPKMVKNDKLLLGNTQNESIFKAALGQSSTSNTLKQFKLKLPSHTPQKSTKNLNISLDISKNTPSKSKTKTDQSKLSITQRLERIELLEREDRIYSHKLYELKHQQQERDSNLSVKADLSLNLAMVKDITSANELPNHKKQVLKEGKVITSSLLTASKTQASVPQASKIAREPLQIPIQSAPSQEIFSSTSRASQPQPQQNISSSRLTHKYFKKRIIYRQKKISEDYMKILQQKGRKILELDNESEA